MSRLARVLACALLLASCGGGDKTGPTPIEVQGTWQGSLTDGSNATISLTLAETAGTVTGSGNLATSATAIAVTVTGTYAEPHVSLTLAAPGFNNTNLSATVGETSMSGTLNGSGYVNAALTLTRQ